MKPKCRGGSCREPVALQRLQDWAKRGQALTEEAGVEREQRPARVSVREKREEEEVAVVVQARSEGLGARKEGRLAGVVVEVLTEHRLALAMKELEAAHLQDVPRTPLNSNSACPS